MWLNITFNYYKNYFPHGLLGDDTDPDYWEPTDGNAKRALIQLRTMAKMRPDAVIKVAYRGDQMKKQDNADIIAWTIFIITVIGILSWLIAR